MSLYAKKTSTETNIIFYARATDTLKIKQFKYAFEISCI